MDGVTFRRASSGDVELLVRLRERFMEERGLLDPLIRPVFAGQLREYVKAALSSGQLVVWLAESGEREAVANGWLCYVQKPPHPNNPTGREGYIVNVHTAPGWRRRGLGRAIMELLLDEARRSAAKIVRLVASESGRPLYDRLGFADDAGSMKLTL